MIEIKKIWLKQKDTHLQLLLVEWILDSMDMSALESFVRENLTEYYSNEVNLNDFENNYAEMKEIKGED